jgi:hypothetical protein
VAIFAPIRRASSFVGSLAGRAIWLHRKSSNGFLGNHSKTNSVDDAEETNVDAAKRLASSQRVGYSRAIQEHLGDRLRAYYERAQDRPVIDCRLAELIEQLSKSLEEKDLQQE